MHQLCHADGTLTTTFIPQSHGAPLPKHIHDCQKRGRGGLTGFADQYYSRRIAVLLPSRNFPIRRGVTVSSPTKQHVQFFPRPLCDSLVVDPSWTRRIAFTEVVLQSPKARPSTIILFKHQSWRRRASFTDASVTYSTAINNEP